MPSLRLFTLASAGAADVLVASVWESAVLVGAVALTLRTLPGLTASVRSKVWLFVLALTTGFPLLSSFRAAHSGGEPISAALRLDPKWGLALAGLWAALSLARVLQLAHGAWKLRSLSRRAVQVQPAQAAAALLQMGKRRVVLCVSSELNRPSAIGFWKPRILLPSGLLQRISEYELQQVILHEMEHLRRKDQWSNLLQKLALAAFPLNPVLLWLDRQLCFERELACDDGVLQCTNAPKAYASCLVNLADKSLLQRGVALALRAWEQPSELARRVERVLNPPQRALSTTRARWVAGALMAGTLTGALMLGGSPHLVSFTSDRHLTEADDSQVPPASFHEPGSLARPMLVKAVMPMRQISPLQTVHSQHQRFRKANLQKSFSHRNRSARAASPWLVVRSWQANFSPAQVTLAVADANSSMSYAAVATRNGWLIVQL